MSKYFLFLILCTLYYTPSFAQKTLIKGFADVIGTYGNDKSSFGFEEQDLFITSQLSDRISFLGESVFKFTPTTPTDFSVSIERLIIKYNIQGNNNIIVGKIHTPLNYWNDTYHHGRVFFPTITRPLLFPADIIPLHTTGVGIEGHDFGKLKFGYQVFIGNGLGSEPVVDNDKRKSITLAAYIKPRDNLQLGVSYYNDIVSKGAEVEGKLIDWRVKQNIFTGTVAYFGKKFELLAEATYAINETDTTGSKNTFTPYIYTGYRITDKITPYIRLDYLKYQTGEILFNKDNTSSFVGGIRYEFNFLAVLKLEYQYLHTELAGDDSRITAQFAIGF